MLRSLPPAHRLARINYPPRALAFAFSLLVIEALMIERGIRGWVLFFGVLQFLVYPHLAYLYARIATDSKRAERAGLRTVAAKGPPRVLDCEGNPVRDHRGSAEMVILVCRDITARAA